MEKEAMDEIKKLNLNMHECMVKTVNGWIDFFKSVSEDGGGNELVVASPHFAADIRSFLNDAEMAGDNALRRLRGASDLELMERFCDNYDGNEYDNYLGALEALQELMKEESEEG